MNKEIKKYILMKKGMKKRPGTAYERSELPERALFTLFSQACASLGALALYGFYAAAG